MSRARRAAAALSAIVSLLAFAGVVHAPRAWGLFGPGRPTYAPAILFVSRNPVPGDPHAVPGLGPRDRTVVTGGRLMLRLNTGDVREFLPHAGLFDVSDPSVSWDGKRVVFAAVTARDSAWRLWTVGADGRRLAPLTRSDRVLDLSRFGAAAARFRRYDDFDPAWLPDGRIVFASTRYPQVAEQGEVLASNLFTIRADGTHLERLTSERNGAEEPCVDPRTGRIVYARWWTSRHFASDSVPGITTERARGVPAPEVDLWQAVSITPDGSFPMLAGGNPRDRAQLMAYQPAVLGDGTLVGVSAERTSLVPAPGAVTTWAFPGGFAAPVRLASGPHGVPGIACAPAWIGGDRIALARDPDGTGDFGLWVTTLKGDLAPLVDLPGTDELDPAVLIARKAPPVIAATASPLPNDAPPAERDAFARAGETFRFDCLNVFANAPVDVPVPDAPAPQEGLRIRFFEALARPGSAGGDTVVLVREAPLLGGGAVHEDGLPADTPMFEQLVDARGRIVRSVSGPAHVPGFNAARFGTGTKCVGCHLGHSIIPVGRSDFEGKRFNAAPAARATATSVLAGSAGAQAAVDRRTLGEVTQVAWIADRATDQALTLRWTTAIDVDSLILYALRSDPGHGTDLKIRSAGLRFMLGGREVGRRTVDRELSPAGTRVACGGMRVDAIEFRPLRSEGKVLGHERTGLAEIATVARLAEF